MGTSKLQRTVGRTLRLSVANTQIYENYRPYWLCDSKGRRLELDFYLPDHNLAIEVQGQQHFSFSKHFHGTHQAFADMLERDRNKAEICHLLGIKLVEVLAIDDLDNVWPLLTGEPGQYSQDIQRRAVKESRICIIDTASVSNLLALTSRAIEQQNPFIVRAMYLRCKNYFRQYFLSSHINRCCPATFQAFIQVGEKARQITRSNAEIYKTNAHVKKQTTRAMKQWSASQSVEQKRKAKIKRLSWRKNKKVSKLSFESIMGGYLVYGGRYSRRVFMKDGRYVCDCNGWPSAKDGKCSHILRVRLEQELL